MYKEKYLYSNLFIAAEHLSLHAKSSELHHEGVVQTMRQLIIYFTISILLSLSTVSCTGNGHMQPSSSQLKAFVEPGAGYYPVLDALNASQKSILMEMYLLTDKKIIGALRRAKTRGADVRILLEKSAYDTPAAFKAVMDDLNSSGISCRTSNPAFRLTHEKSIVIDHQIAFIMTLNQDLTAYSRNREFGIIDKNPADITEITAVFENDWNRTAPVLSDPNLIWSPVNSRIRINKLIDGAKKSLYVENEEMQDTNVEDHLISAANRGVDVRVVMSPSNFKNDANAPGRDRIKKGGVKVRLLKSPYIHAKILIADGSRAFVGSENFSPTSMNRNRAGHSD
jgi:cardiolipin synthase